jgi:hypothetical protein
LGLLILVNLEDLRLSLGQRSLADMHFTHRPFVTRMLGPKISLLTIVSGAVCICSGGGLVAYAESAAESAPEPSQNPPKKKVLVLGTGWAATSFIRNLDCSRYEVKVISPRNYFAFTPLLPSVTCGTVEPRSIVEPIRRMFEKVLVWPNHSLSL